MNILAIETSSRMLSVALWRGGAVIQHSEDLPNAGSEHVLPWTSALLAEAGLAMAAVDAVAFGAGPGGFVGLRLACGVAQGLAFGLDVPVLGVGCLEALALEAGAEHVYACVDARMNEVYVAAYRMTDGQAQAILPPGVCAPGEVPLPPAGSWLGAGDGFVAHGDVLRQHLGQSVVDVRAVCWPTAAAVARLAAPRLARGEGVDAAQATPLYVRDKVALTTAERRARGGVR